jgi:hypothetical protein
MRQFSTFLGSVALLLTSCATSSPIQRYNESASNFSKPPELISNSYLEKDIYRIYQRASTGFTPMQSLRNSVELRAFKFAEQQGKTFLVLGERISQPPYILGNFPRIEIVFVLIDKTEKATGAAPKHDKFTELEKLKKLLDNGTLTKEEYQMEKKKILDDNQ